MDSAPPPYFNHSTAPQPNPSRHVTLDSLPEHILLSTLISLPVLSRYVRSTSRHLHLLANVVLREALLPV